MTIFSQVKHTVAQKEFQGIETISVYLKIPNDHSALNVKDLRSWNHQM